MNDKLWEKAKSWGYREGDRWQIDDCWKNAKCELLKADGEWKATSNERARKALGAETYLSGCCRAAFHATAVRETEDGARVLFSYDLRG